MNLIALLLFPGVISLFLLPCIANRMWASTVSAIVCTFSFIVAVLLAVHVYQQQVPIFFFHQWFICDKLGIFFVLINSLIGMTTSFSAISYLSNENNQ